MRGWYVSCAALLVVACSCSKKSASSSEPTGSAAPAAPEATAPAAGSAAPAAGDAGQTPLGLAAAIDQAFAAAKLTLAPVPAPAAGATAAKEPEAFLGWSKDGQSYLARTTYDVPEDLGIEGIGFSLVEVRDTATQQVIESYQDQVWPERKRLGELLQDERESDAKDVPVALWDAAKPVAERGKLGDRFLDLGKVSFGKPDKHAKRASESAKLAASVRGKHPYKSKLAVTDESYGFSFSWSGFKVEPANASAKTRSAGVELVATTQAGTFPLVTIASTHNYESLAAGVDESEPSVEGQIRAYWSPAGTHVAFNVIEAVDGGHEEMGYGVKTRSFVRALGPQIKVIAAGISYEHARKAAALIAHAGHPVTVVEQAATPSTGAVVYYRGDAGKQAADAIVELLPGARAEPLAKPGWLDVIVTLGT